MEMPTDFRQQKRWPKEARQLVAEHLTAVRQGTIESANERAQLRNLVTKLVALTRYSRQTCLRFARRFGVRAKQPYREWSHSDQQKLLDLIALNPPMEVARIMRRSPGSVRAKLQRLGASAQMGRDWFTKYTLAEALHISVTEVQRWVEQGWLKTRVVQTGEVKKEIIDADDFTQFCKLYRAAIVGRRLNADRLAFVQNYVFPSSHTDLLPVRDSKRERACYEAQVNGKKVHRSRRISMVPKSGK
jgi:hypothetical protein